MEIWSLDRLLSFALGWLLFFSWTFQWPIKLNYSFLDCGIFFLFNICIRNSESGNSNLTACGRACFVSYHVVKMRTTQLRAYHVSVWFEIHDKEYYCMTMCMMDKQIQTGIDSFHSLWFVYEADTIHQIAHALTLSFCGQQNYILTSDATDDVWCMHINKCVCLLSNESQQSIDPIINMDICHIIKFKYWHSSWRK